MVSKVVICYNTGIIVTTRVIIVGSVCCHCNLTSVWWIPNHLSCLRQFVLEWILYTFNNCGNESYLFGVNFGSGDRISCICSFTLLATFIYYLFSSWIFQYTLLSTAADLQSFFLLYRLVGSLYVNTSSLSSLFLLPCPSRPPPPPLLQSPLPSNLPPLSPLIPLPYDLNWLIRPYLPDDD